MAGERRRGAGARLAKRAVDVSAAAAGLLCLAPIFALVSALIRLDSDGPVLFTQERVGRDFRPFRIYKFRTMVRDAPRLGAPLTAGARDPRVTRIGRLLRKTKIDELPQLLNVLKGEMSLVGPRPELPIYVARFRRDYEEILRVRPGMTDLASLRFRDEASLLEGAADPEELYLRSILPEKLRLGKAYVREASLRLDLALITKTLAALSGVRVSV